MPRHNPFTIKVELVRGCTRRCPFCALSTIPWREDAWHFMSPLVWQAMIDDLARWLPKCRIEIAERGEPSYHPQLKALLAYGRAKLPQAQFLLITNGDTIKQKREKYRDWLLDLFDDGLNLVLLDCYDPERYAAMTALFTQPRPAQVTISDFFADNRHPYTYYGVQTREIIIVNATPGQHNTIRWYQNQAGNVDIAQAAAAGFTIPDAPAPLAMMCVRPFRELVLHFDGRVPICCQDWREEGTIGQFPQQDLQTLWHSMDGYRQHLLQKDRAALSPCYKCSDRAGFRWGLDKDWFATVPPVAVPAYPVHAPPGGGEPPA